MDFVTKTGDESEIYQGKVFESCRYSSSIFSPLVKMLPEPPRFNQLAASLVELWGDRFDEVYAACENVLAAVEGHPMSVEYDSYRTAAKEAMYVNCNVLTRTGVRYFFNLRLTNKSYGTTQQVGHALGLTPAASMMLTSAMLDLYYVPDGEIAAVNSSKNKNLSVETSLIRCPDLYDWCGLAFDKVKQIMEMSTFVEDVCAKVSKKIPKSVRNGMGFGRLEQELFSCIHPQYAYWNSLTAAGPSMLMAQEYSRVKHFPIINTIRQSLDYLRAIQKDEAKVEEFPVELIGCCTTRLKVG